MSNCIVCNSVIKSQRRGKKYCSNSCKQRAYYNRKNKIYDAPDEKINLFQVYLQVVELLGDGYNLPYSEFLFIKSCNPFVTSTTELSLLVQKTLEDVYGYSGEADPVYKRSLDQFMLKWYDRGVSGLV